MVCVCACKKLMYVHTVYITHTHIHVGLHNYARAHSYNFIVVFLDTDTDGGDLYRVVWAVSDPAVGRRRRQSGWPPVKIAKGTAAVCARRRRGRGRGRSQTQGHTYEPCRFLFAISLTHSPRPPTRPVIRRSISFSLDRILTRSHWSRSVHTYFRFRDHRRLRRN